MAAIVKRGTRSAPKFYVQYHRGRTTDGEPVRCSRLLKGVQNLLQARQEAARVERELAAGRDPFATSVVVPGTVGPVSPLIQQWAQGLTNRNSRDDRSRALRHLVPTFGRMKLEEITLPAVMNWIDELAASDLSPQSQRHALGTLSRFFSWCVERGLATVNPVRMVPVGKRPSPSINPDQPWLEDETKVPALMGELGNDVGLMFYLSNRSGLRLGEVCGLRLSDLEFVREGAIRVGHSYGGPLKEDKRSEGKVKWVPAPVDAEQVLRLHLKRLKLKGAKPDALVFPYVPAKRQNRRRTSDWNGYRKEYVEALWEAAAEKHGVNLTWYQATRHSFVSRALRDGAPLDEVSVAVGHATPAITKRHYAHFVRKTFNPVLRQGLPSGAK
jgi:integrase